VLSRNGLSRPKNKRGLCPEKKEKEGTETFSGPLSLLGATSLKRMGAGFPMKKRWGDQRPGSVRLGAQNVPKERENGA